MVKEPATPLLSEITPTGAQYAAKASRRAMETGERRRTAFLEALIESKGVVWKAVEISGINRKNYDLWRSRYPHFRAKVDSIKASFFDGVHARSQTIGGFAEHRKRFFGFDSPWFHLEVVQALESSPEGSVTLILLPPEHGKSTLLEDFACYKLDENRDFRITVGSEKQNHGKKMIARVKARMHADTGPLEWIQERGPFGPAPGGRHSQVWAEDRFNVFGRSGDERDYSMIAQGITSSVVGSRSDLMVIDDIQSLKSLNQSEDIFRQLRQDWLSRTGAFGRVVIIGTRVGPGDVYEMLEESTLVNRVIRYPAYRGPAEAWPPPEGANPKEDPEQIPDHIDTFLWPERYSPLNYLVMRVNAGEDGWNRNYMQRGDLAGSQAFSQGLVDAAGRPEFSVVHRRHHHLAGELVATLDPGFGVNATMVSLMTPQFILPILWRSDHGLTNNQAIWQILEDSMREVQGHGPHRVTELVIEDKAFQKGLLEDEGLHELRSRFGFRVHGHQTGANKYDPDLGIPQMARAFERSEILLPNAPDEATQRARAELDKQLMNWRPYRKGNKLTQDLVICLWFAWMTWRRVRDLLDQGISIDQSWKTTALPYAPTSTGLLLPTGGYSRG